MKLKEFYEKQKYLENFVMSRCELSEEEFSSVGMIDKRIFAFKVEFGEFANETGWFKYWKKSHVINQDHALEELADCIHFLLAIGIYCKYEQHVPELDWQRWDFLDEQELYTSIMESGLHSSGQWKSVFEYLICIGVKAGFSIEQIELNYYLKNQKNIERQFSGY